MSKLKRSCDNLDKDGDCLAHLNEGRIFICPCLVGGKGYPCMDYKEITIEVRRAT